MIDLNRIELADPWLLSLPPDKLRRVIACAHASGREITAKTRTRPHVLTKYADDVAANASGTFEFQFSDGDTFVERALGTVRGAVVTITNAATPSQVDTYASIPTRILEDASDWVEALVSASDNYVGQSDYAPLSHVTDSFGDVRPWMRHGTRVNVAYRMPAQVAADRVQLSLVCRIFE